MPTIKVTTVEQVPGPVPIATPVVFARRTPVWSLQKARLPVTSTTVGVAFASNPLLMPATGVFPRAANA